MGSVLQIPTDPTLRRIHQIQTIIVSMIVEACVSLSAAWMARSPALLAFGGGQHNRTPIGWRSVVALSGATKTGTCLVETSWWFLVGIDM